MKKNRYKQQLAMVSRDYEEITGKQFNHFFCPILAIDEPCDLICGHIINKSFKGASREWVIQRKDVDNFYGSFFESDFELLQYRHEIDGIDLLSDNDLRKKLKPKILMNDMPVPYTSNISPTPKGYIPVIIGASSSKPALAIKMDKHDLGSLVNQKWEFGMVIDLKIPALASLLKAAHLTLFHLIGYRYSLSSAGIFIGKDILGRFFRSNVGLTKKEIRNNSWSFFREFRSMYRPINLKIEGYRVFVGNFYAPCAHI